MNQTGLALQFLGNTFGAYNQGKAQKQAQDSAAAQQLITNALAKQKQDSESNYQDAQSKFMLGRGDVSKYVADARAGAVKYAADGRAMVADRNGTMHFLGDLAKNPGNLAAFDPETQDTIGNFINKAVGGLTTPDTGNAPPVAGGQPPMIPQVVPGAPPSIPLPNAPQVDAPPALPVPGVGVAPPNIPVAAPVPMAPPRHHTFTDINGDTKKRIQAGKMIDTTNRLLASGIATDAQVQAQFDNINALMGTDVQPARNPDGTIDRKASLATTSKIKLQTSQANKADTDAAFTKGPKTDLYKSLIDLNKKGKLPLDLAEIALIKQGKLPLDAATIDLIKNGRLPEAKAHIDEIYKGVIPLDNYKMQGGGKILGMSSAQINTEIDRLQREQDTLSKPEYIQDPSDPTGTKYIQGPAPKDRGRVFTTGKNYGGPLPNPPMTDEARRYIENQQRLDRLNKMAQGLDPSTGKPYIPPTPPVTSYGGGALPGLGIAPIVGPTGSTSGPMQHKSSVPYSDGAMALPPSMNSPRPVMPTRSAPHRGGKRDLSKMSNEQLMQIMLQKAK